MNIAPVTTNDKCFKGTLTVRDIKANKLLKFNIPEKERIRISEKFASTDMLNDRLQDFTGGGAAKGLEKLKSFVKYFSESVQSNFHKELTYPEVSNFAVNYKVTDTLSEINAPNYFSIKLEA